MIVRRIATLARAYELQQKRERILDALFPLQRRVLLGDERFIAGHPGRRAGKSWLVIGFLLYYAACSPPDTLCPYISTSRKRAKRNVWGVVNRMDRELQLGLDYQKTELTASIPGAGGIWVTGCADEAQVDEFPGDAYPAVAIDEAGAFPLYLEELVNRALLPALTDYRGKLLICGTPPPSPVGLFHRIIAEGSVAGWGECFHWTMVDNPHIPHAAKEMAEIRQKRGWSEDHPTYRREYLGDPHVTDESMLVYSGYHDGVLVEKLPPGRYRYVLGIDFGWSETRTTTAFALLAYSLDRPVSYIVRTWAKTAQTSQQIAEEIRSVEAEKEVRQAGGLEAVVADPGGFGRKYIDELNIRERLPVQAAEKTDKRGFIQLINSDMKTGRLRAVREGTKPLVGEYLVLPWADERRREEKSGVPNHHADATLYVWRRCLSFGFRPKEPHRFSPESEEGQREEEQRLIKGLEKQVKEQKEGKWWRRKQNNSRAARMPWRR